MKMSYENQVKKANTADQRANSLEAKLKRLIQNNITLDTELQNASKAIVIFLECISQRNRFQ